MKVIFSKLIYQLEKGADCVLVSIVAASGSAPRTEGSQMLVNRFGRLCGSIGGGAIEKNAEEIALSLLNEKRSELRQFGLHPDAKTDIGMICGGDVTVLFTYICGKDKAWAELASAVLGCMESGRTASLLLYADGKMPSLRSAEGKMLFGEKPAETAEYFALPFSASRRAVIFGAGHIARALCPLLKTVDFTPVIFDDRREYADAKYFPDAQAVICGDFTRISEKLEIFPEDFVVVMTSGHANDYAVEKQMHSLDVAYLGIIGSKSKRASVREKLMAEGVSAEKLDTVHTPVGTAIRAVTPEEIAVSIAGEMILVRASLRDDGSDQRPCPV